MCDRKQEDEIVSHLFLIPQDKGFGDFLNSKFFKTFSKSCFVEPQFNIYEGLNIILSTIISILVNNGNTVY